MEKRKFNKLVIFFISAMNSGVPTKQFTLHSMRKAIVDLQLFVPSNPQGKTMLKKSRMGTHPSKV